MTEETLSDKIIYGACCPDYIGVINQNDVKEFIRKLKDKFEEQREPAGNINIEFYEFREIIDKLIGEKLI